MKHNQKRLIQIEVNLQQTKYKNKNRMNKNMNHVIVDEEDFDPVIRQKAQIKNNSGYLDEEYQTTKEFPLIPDYHFRVEDDLTILEFQKMALNDPTAQPLRFQSASSKFQNKLNSLLEGINKVQIKPDNNQSHLTQQHGFYSLEGEYDSDAAIKQAFGRLQLVQLEDKMKQLQLNEKKPKFIKKAKVTDKMRSQAAAPVSNLSKQFNKLSIDQEDM